MEWAQIVGLIIVIGLIFSSAFYRWKPIVWTILIGGTLFILPIYGFLSPKVALVAWIPFLIAALFANLALFRQRYIIRPALETLKNQIPTISKTEKTAIDAGDTWWEKDLFCGRPDWNKLFSIPKPTLSAEEESFISNQVDHLCSMLNDWQIVFDEHDLPNEVWQYLKAEKFFGMVIPKQYGGLGFSALAHSTIVTKIATRSLSAAVTTMVPNSLGPGELLVHYGTDDQKNYYLPRLAAGQEIPCFALTSPEAGSDAGAIPDNGIVCRGQHQGKEVIGIRLSWDKRYITLAPIATLLGLAIHLYDPEKLLGEKEDIGITLCLIPTSHPGVEIGSRHYPIYTAFMNGPTRGKDVFIPLDWIIGGAEMAGEGWRMLMENLSIGRSISLPALSAACGKVAYRITGAYSRVRRQFNASISSFEGIEEALGYIAGNAYLLEACRTMTAGAVDQKINPAIVSAIAKYHMTEMSRQSVMHAMDVHGGQMIQVGPRNVLANMHVALPISITVEGANILTRNLIIFGQGAIRCHPYLLREIALITAKDPSIPAIDSIIMSHVGYFTTTLIRNIAYGLTGGSLIVSHQKLRRIKKLQRQLTRMSAALALLSDASLILLGGSLKRRERISARLGDILSQLYLASTVLKFYSDHGKQQSDVDYVCWTIQHCLYQIQVAADDVLNNFPVKWIGRVLSWIIFPYGRAYQKPDDKLNKRIVTAMLSSSELRDRLTRYTYLGGSDSDLICRLDKALDQVSEAEAIMKKLHKAVQSHDIPKRYTMPDRINAAKQSGLLSNEEVETLNHYEQLKNEIIKVNEFSFNLEKIIA